MTILIGENVFDFLFRKNFIVNKRLILDTFDISAFANNTINS